jgi:hypothetical protein
VAVEGPLTCLESLLNDLPDDRQATTCWFYKDSKMVFHQLRTDCFVFSRVLAETFLPVDDQLVTAFLIFCFRAPFFLCDHFGFDYSLPICFNP